MNRNALFPRALFPVIAGMILSAFLAFGGCVKVETTPNSVSPPGKAIVMKAAGFDKEGVKLIAPTDESFDAMVDKLAPPGWSSVLKNAKPWLAAVSNETDHKIVAFTTVFRTGGGEGAGPAASSSFFVAPDAIGNPGVDFGDRAERGVLSGGQRLMGSGFAIPEFEPKDVDRNWVIEATGSFIDYTRQANAGATTVEIELDAVIFDDGRLIGPDKANLGVHFGALVQARQGLYRAIIQRLDRGETVDAAYQEATNLTSPAAGVAPSEAASTARTLRKKYGDAKIREVLQRALHQTPFVIRRK